MLPLRARVDLGAMAIKVYSTFPKAPALLEPHHPIFFSVISRTLIEGGVLPPLQRAVGVFYNPANRANSMQGLKDVTVENQKRSGAPRKISPRLSRKLGTPDYPKSNGYMRRAGGRFAFIRM